MEKRNLNSGQIIMFLLMIGIGGRILLDGYPNIETVMVSVFLAAMLLPRHLSLIVIFTYSGFLLVNIFGSKIQKWMSGKFGSNAVLKFSGAGISFALIFDLWTNFGVWFLSYEHTVGNLITVYVLGIPFMLYHMMSSVATFTMIGVPVYYGLSETVDKELSIGNEDAQREH